MKKPSQTAILWVAVFVLFSCNPQTENVSVIIENVTIIDAEKGSVKGQTVVIQDNKILDVLSVGSSLNYTAEQTIDGSGKYLIPGLWDAHVHLTFEPELESSMFRLFLGYGITSVRDTGGELKKVMPWKEQSLSSPGTSPRVMVAGPLLDGVPTVYDGSSPGRPTLGIGAATPDDAKKLVDQFVESGVDLIKSYEMLTPETFEAVLSRAKEQGKVVTGHVPLSMDVIEVSKLGLRSMEHMRNLEMACSADFDSLQKARHQMLSDGEDLPGGDLRSSIHQAQRMHAYQTQDKNRRNEVLKALFDNGTWQVPTLSIVTVGTLRPFAEDSWTENAKYLPDPLKSRWIEDAKIWDENPVDPLGAAMTEWALDMINHLKNADIPLMAGTDTPIAFLIPGYSLHDELALLVEGGLTPLEALESATLFPAQYFNLEDSLGTISKTKWADLVLLNANPLDNIRNTLNINTVIRGGTVYNRTALDDMLLYRGPN